MVDIIQDLAGKTRNIPVSPDYLKRIEGIVSSIDPSLGVRITSGGQPAKGTSKKRTGSTRHDVDEHGHVGTSDFVLTRNGRDVLPGQDKALYSRLFEEAGANGFTGMGHYSWGVHVGGGSKAAWGPSTGSKSLDPEFGAAIKRGWARAGNGAGTPAPVDPGTMVGKLASGPEMPPEAGPFNVDLSYRGGTISAPVEKQAFDPGEATGGWQVVKDAAMSEQSAIWAYRQIMGPGFEPDPTYNLTEDNLKADFGSKGIDLDPYSDLLAQAGSTAHYNHIRNMIYEDHDRQQRLNDAGVAGMSLRLLNNMLDIGTLPGDIIVGSVAPELVLAKKASRLHKALVGGMAGASAGAMSAALETTVNPHRDSSDVFYGALFGFGFGGLAGGLRRNPHTLDEAAKVQKLGQDLAAEAEGGFTGAGSVGAAAVRGDKPFLDNTAFDLIQDGEVAKTAMSKARFSLGAKLHGSKNPIARLGAYLVQDGVGKTGANVNGIAVTEEVSRLTGQMMTGYHRTYNPMLEQFKKNNGYGYFDGDAAAVDFNERVTAYIRDRSFDNRDSRHAAEVVQMGKKVNEINEELRQLANNPFIREGLSGRAVAGFDKIAADPHYIMRQWDAKRIAQAREKYGEAVLEDLIFGSMRKANHEVPDALLQKASRGFSRAIVNNAFGVEDMMLRKISSENVDDMVEMMVMHGGLSKEDATDLINGLTTKAKDAGRDSRAKHRTILDETFELTNVMSKNGVREPRLKITDLLNNDATHLTTSYVRRMSGLISLARFRIKDPKTGEVILDGITKDSEWDAFMRVVNKKGADMEAAGKQSSDARAYDMKGLQFAYDNIRGRPVSDAGKLDDWLRTVREINFSRVGHQMGFAQIPEFGNIIGNLGIKAAFSHMPVLRRMVNESGESIRRSGFADDMELFTPYGVENLTHNTSMRFDDFSGRPNSLNRGTVQQRIEGVARKATRMTSVASGMAHVNEALQTMVSQGIVQKFAIMAHAKKGFSVKRLADMGIDEAMGQRIYNQFRKEGNFEYTRGALTGKKIVRAHFDKWDDLEAREALRNAVWRYSTSIIQKNDLGNMPLFMSNKYGKTLMQFRSFIVGAWEKQTLRSVHMRDMPAFMGAMMSMVFAGATYMVQEKLRAIGRKDADKHLKDRLSYDNIAKAAVARAGMASIAPMIMDSTVSTALFGKPAWDFRTSDQGQSMIFGNPTMGLFLEDLPGALGGVVRPAVEGRSISQKEAKTIGRVFGFTNFLPTSWALSSMIGNLPRRPPQDTTPQWFK